MEGEFEMKIEKPKVEELEIKYWKGKILADLEKVTDIRLLEFIAEITVNSKEMKGAGVDECYGKKCLKRHMKY